MAHACIMHELVKIQKVCDVMGSMKERLVSDIMENIGAMPDDILKAVENAVIVSLYDYDVIKAETAVAIYEGDQTEYYIKKFLVSKRVNGCTEKTLQAYGTIIPRIIREINKPVVQITTDDIRYYMAIREMRDGVSKITLDNDLRFLKTFFNFMVDEDFMPKNPAAKISKIKGPKLKKKALSDMDIEKIRNACENHKEKAVIELLLSTGCRASELVNMKKEHIRGNAIKVLGKGQKERIVFMNAKAEISVANYIAERTDENPYLFPKTKPLGQRGNIKGVKRGDLYKVKDAIEKDGHADIGAIENTVRNIGKRAGVENVHPHRFRRTCATLALRRGMPVEQVGQMLGHEQLTTTQIYLDLQDEELEQAHRKYVV